MGTGPISPYDSTAPCRHLRTARLCGEEAVAPNHCWLLFLFQWRRGNGRRRWGGRQRGSWSWRHWSYAGRRWRSRGHRRRGGGVMPMTVLGGPHFSRRDRAGRLRSGRELALRRCVRIWNGKALRWRRCAGRGRSRLFRRSRRLGQKVSARRTDDHTADDGQYDY